MRALRLAAVLLVGLSLSAPARAQFAEGGARYLGTGRAGAALGGEAWGHANPAAWAGLDGGRAAVQASQAFGLSELRLGALTAALPTAAGTAALHARTYGFSERRETRVVAGFARGLPLSVSRRLDVGVSVGVESASTEGYGTETAVVVGLGVQGDVLPGLRAGLAGRNLLGLGLGDEADLRRSAAAVPGVTVGIAYAPSDRATLVLDADQDLDFGLAVRGGVEVRVVEALALRTGVTTNPARFTAGAGVRAGALRADLAVELHETLGATPAVGIEVAF